MKRYHQPSGLLRGLEFLIDPDWSPDQELAIVALLDDLHDRIRAHYEKVLQQKYRDYRVTQYHVDITDPPI